MVARLKILSGGIERTCRGFKHGGLNRSWGRTRIFNEHRFIIFSDIGVVIIM